jgi:hypothetical protein
MSRSRYERQPPLFRRGPGAGVGEASTGLLAAGMGGPAGLGQTLLQQYQAALASAGGDLLAPSHPRSELDGAAAEAASAGLTAPDGSAGILQAYQAQHTAGGGGGGGGAKHHPSAMPYQTVPRVRPVASAGLTARYFGGTR